MGTRGPVPKRSTQRLGHTSKASRDETSKPVAATAPDVPPPAPDWHPVARAWYESLASSAQSQYYEPSDWQAARLVAGEMTRMLTADFPSPTLFKAIWSAMDALLTTEGARRRVNVEVQKRAQTASASDAVAILDDYRHAVRSS